MTEVQLFTEQQQQSQMSVSLNVQLLCTDSDVHGSECRLICDRGVLFCFVLFFLGRSAFTFIAVVWIQGVSAAL